jgi:hypothetical protein
MSSFSYRKLLQIADEAIYLLDNGMNEKDICIKLKIKSNTLEKALEYSAEHNALKSNTTREVPPTPVNSASSSPILIPESFHPTPSPSPCSRDINFKYKVLQHHMSGLNIKIISEVMQISEQEVKDILVHFNMCT